MMTGASPKGRRSAPPKLGALRLDLARVTKKLPASSRRARRFEIEIAAIHDIKGAGFGPELIQNIDVMHFAVADEDKGGNVAA